MLHFIKFVDKCENYSLLNIIIKQLINVNVFPYFEK